MWEKLRVIFTIPELRQKILLTLLLLAIYRVGWQIVLPIVDQSKMAATSGSGGVGDLLKQVAVFSASQLNQTTIFGLGIMPYISASIIFQILGTVWPPLEKLQKEGESGRKKINEYTRYATVVICAFQSWMYVSWMAGSGFVQSQFLTESGSMLFSWHVMSVVTMTTGTVFLMWLGEQIDEYGIGNGISLLIMAGILADLPQAGLNIIRPLREQGLQLSGATPGEMGVDTLMILAALFVGIVLGTVLIMQGQRRIPTYSAKHVRGRRVFGGTKSYLPLRVNQSGVMPIVFASSLLLIPAMLFQWLSSVFPTSMPLQIVASSLMRGQSYLYNLLFVALIFFFCFFWTAITFNPKDIADNLKDFGSFIQGYRPGKRTADYLERVMVRITYVGAAFLAIIAIAPTVVAAVVGIDPSIARFFGGTGLLIAVSVAFDLVQKIDSHLVMRNYKGLLEKG